MGQRLEVLKVQDRRLQVVAPLRAQLHQPPELHAVAKLEREKVSLAPEVVRKRYGAPRPGGLLPRKSVTTSVQRVLDVRSKLAQREQPPHHPFLLR